MVDQERLDLWSASVNSQCTALGALLVSKVSAQKNDVDQGADGAFAVLFLIRALPSISLVL